MKKMLRSFLTIIAAATVFAVPLLFVSSANAAPAPPMNLSASSPTKQPVLSWNSVPGATLYSIYRDGNQIDSTSTTTYTDGTAPEGTDSYYVTALDQSGESGPSNDVNVLVDRTPPTVTAQATPAPNAAGWNNSLVTVSYTCSDAGSGIAVCPKTQKVGTQGTNQTIQGTATDNAGNTATATTVLNIDTTAPDSTSWVFADPAIPVNTGTTLSASVLNDNLSGVVRAEYFLSKDTWDPSGFDPGAGNATPMTISNGIATGAVSPISARGTYWAHVRIEDAAGNWSNVAINPQRVNLFVYPVLRTLL
jgi:hypothetical protein